MPRRTPGITKRVGPKGTRWEVRVYAGRDPVTGKRRRPFHTVDTWNEAVKLKAELQEQARRGTNSDDALTLRHFVDTRWWPAKRANIKATTAQGYRNLLDGEILPTLGDLPIQDVTPDRIATMLARKVKAGSIGRAEHIHVLLHSIMAAATRLRVIERNPVADVDKPRPPRKEMTTLTTDECWRLLESLEGHWAQLPIALMLATGVRRSELCGLQWRDVDLDAKTLTVRRGYHRLRGGKVFVEGPKRIRSTRTITLDDDSCALLADHRSKAAKQATEAYGETLEPTDYVFARPDRTPWPPDSISRVMYRKRKELGIVPDLHGLRHSNASLMLAAGVSLSVVSARLGHSSAGFTLSRYVHLLPDAEKEAAQRFGDYLKNSRPMPLGYDARVVFCRALIALANGRCQE